MDTTHWTELAHKAAEPWLSEDQRPNWDSAGAHLQMLDLRPDDYAEGAWILAVDEAIAAAAALQKVPTPPTEGPEAIWSKRDSLATIQRHARARITSEWSLLGGAITRALASVPWWVYYKTDFRGPQPLNSVHVVVGNSGSDKSITQHFLNDVLRFEAPHLHPFPAALAAGSGEGIEDAYLAEVPKIGDDGKPVKVDGQPVTVEEWCNDQHALRWYVDEIGKLSSVGKGRQGTTLFENIKSAATGEQLGRVLANRKGRMIPAKAYRFNLEINGQPERCAAILTADEIAGGFPQRITWWDTRPEGGTVALPVERTEDVPPLVIPAMDWGLPSNAVCFQAPKMLEDLHMADRLAARSGQTTALDGHVLMNRAKVAVALAVLDGRQHLTDEDVELAGLIMEHSRRTLESVQRSLSAATSTEAKAEGARRAAVDEGQQEAKAQAALERVARSVLHNMLTKGVTFQGAKQALAHRDRHYHDALRDLVQATGQDPELVLRELCGMGN